MDAGETTAGRLEERNYEDFLRGETRREACSLPPTSDLMTGFQDELFWIVHGAVGIDATVTVSIIWSWKSRGHIARISETL